MRKRLLFDEDEKDTPVVIEQTPPRETRRKIVTPIKRKEKSFTRYNVEYAINDDCISTMPIKEWIANGRYGSVFLVCVEHVCEYVLKMIPLNVYIPTEECDISQSENELENICFKYSEDDFLHETDLTIKFGEAKIGPKVKVFGFCNDVVNKYQGKIKVGYIVQEKYDFTLNQYISKHPKEFIENYGYIRSVLIEKAKLMDNMGHFNEDVHQENIMLKVDENGEIKDVVFIDFGIVGNYLEGDIGLNKTQENVDEFLTKLLIDVQRKYSKSRAHMKELEENSDNEGDSEEHKTKRTLFGDEVDEVDEVEEGEESHKRYRKRTLFEDYEEDKNESLKRTKDLLKDDVYHGEPVSWHKSDPTKGYMPRHPVDDVLLKRKHEKEERERDLRKKKKKNKQKETTRHLGSLYDQMEKMKLEEENPSPHFGYRQVFYG